MEASSGDGRHPGEIAHWNGNVTADVGGTTAQDDVGGTIAQLAGVVVPSSPDRAIALQRQAMGAERENCSGSGDGRHSGEITHGNGHVAADVGAVAQLASKIVPPSPDRAIALQRETVAGSSGDGRH